MQRLIVNVKRLNKRRLLPTHLPDPSNIVGEVLAGFSFEGEAVDPLLMPNPNLGKWYKDRDGYFYWGGGVIDISAGFPVAEVVVEEELQRILPTWITDLGLDEIWNLTQGENTRVAVLDTGYNSAITDLAEGVKKAAVFIQSVNGSPISVEDKFGHGSHCASLIGGRNKNFTTACAPKSDLYIAKISSQGAVSSYQNIVNAIQWAMDNNVDIVSISYGGEANDPDMEDIISRAVNNHNILVIAAIGDVIPHAGNKPCFPALQNDCIAVGATNDQHQIASVTIIDPETEINAHGQSISGYSLTQTPVPMTGTSQSTAIVAGICALIISRYKALGRNYTTQSIRDLIINTADPIPSNPGQRMINPRKIFQQL